MVFKGPQGKQMIFRAPGNHLLFQPRARLQEEDAKKELIKRKTLKMEKVKKKVKKKLKRVGNIYDRKTGLRSKIR